MLQISRYLIVIIIILACHNARALSEYGLRCEDNPKCVTCRADIDCIKCMHRCWNAYGYADSDIKNTSGKSADELCQQKRAKWCNAQCWDKDDVKNPDYVSTKPNCTVGSFPFKDSLKFPDNRPGF